LSESLAKKPVANLPKATSADPKSSKLKRSAITRHGFKVQKKQNDKRKAKQRAELQRKLELGMKAEDRFVIADEKESRKQQNLEALKLWKPSEKDSEYKQKVCLCEILDNWIWKAYDPA
jgi:hypothetical protein